MSDAPVLKRKREPSMTPGAIRQRKSRSLRKPGGKVVSIEIRGRDVGAIERALSNERLAREHPVAAAALAAIRAALLHDD